MPEVLSWQEFILRMAAAAGAGMLIGLEREWREKAAGFRTITLVAVGTATFVLGALSVAPDESVRMMAGITAGIGFLGAGAIIQSRGAVHGLTTAATVWMAAALGSTAALGLFALTAIGVLFTLVVLSLLSLLPFEKVQRDVRTYDLSFARTVPMARALSPEPMVRAGVSATLLTVRVEEDRVSSSWLVEGTRQAHRRAIELLSADDDVTAFSSTE